MLGKWSSLTVTINIRMMINANTVSNYSGLMLRMSAFQQNSKLSTTILTGRGHDFFNDATFLLSPLAWPITIHKCRSASTSVDEIIKKKHHLIGFRYTTTKQAAMLQRRRYRSVTYSVFAVFFYLTSTPSHPICQLYSRILQKLN